MPLLSWFKRLQADSIREMRLHLLWWILIRLILFSLLFGLTSFLRQRIPNLLLPTIPVTAAFLLGLYGVSLGSALLLQRLPQLPIRRFAALQLCFDVGFIGLLVYATGCGQSDFTALLILPVITAGLLLSRVGGLFIAAVATFTYAAILACEQLGWLPGYFTALAYKPPASLLNSTNLFAIYGLLFFLAALLSGQLSRRLLITEQKLQRTTLEYDRLSILYKQIFDDISTGIITINQEDFITSFNQAAERITGYTRPQVLGQPFSLCFPSVFLRERQGRSVCDFSRPDGEAIRLGYSFSFLNMPGPTNQEEPAARWKVITLQDISRIERMERQVREAEKMAAIGEMSASIAHGFRNPLAAISGSAQILFLEQENIAAMDRATFKTLLGIILREGERMATTITDFLQFARPAPMQPEWFDLNRLVDEALVQVRSLTNHPGASTLVGREIEQRLGGWGDRQQLQVVLTHLVENACQAVPIGPGSVVIAGHEQGGVGDGSGDQQSWLCVEVRDRGPGIPPESREQVFTPFSTSRPDGTGLGLAIVRQIVENHGGTVEIDSSAEYGCILRLLLPLPAGTTP